MRRRRRSRFSSRNPVFRRPSILEPVWQGAPLAFEQLEDLLERIRHALQPPRADIIDRAVRTALRVVDLLEDFWESMPPGTTPFVRGTERRDLSGWPGAVSPQTREEIEEEEEEEEREERRDRDDDDDDWEPVRIRDRRRQRDRDEDEDEDEDEDDDDLWDRWSRRRHRD